MNFLVKKGIKVKSIRKESFGKVELTFLDVGQANRYGDMPLDELVAAIDNSRNIIQMERMKQRLFNARDRTQSSSYSHLILMTIEGGSLPQFLSVYNGVTKIKVKSYIEPVRQCFICLRYGHLIVAEHSTENVQR